jgi:hypothetical protein
MAIKTVKETNCFRVNYLLMPDSSIMRFAFGVINQYAIGGAINAPMIQNAVRMVIPIMPYKKLSSIRNTS